MPIYPVIGGLSALPMGGGQSTWHALSIAGAAGSSGVFASALNPFGQSMLVVNAVLHVATASSGASALDIGVAADATTSNDVLFDGLDGAVAGAFHAADNGGTNGTGAQVWGATQYLNVAEASGNVTALVATLYVEVIPISG